MGSTERLLRVFPGLLAAGLAFVYVLGALATGSEFSGAGMDAREAVPLLSIEQLLARGIGVVVDPTTLTSMGILVVMFGMVVLFYLAGPLPDRRIALSALSGLAAGMWLTLLVFAPLTVLPGTVCASLGFLLGLSAAVMPMEQGGWRRLAPVTSVVLVMLGFGINAYTNPAQIATATLDLTSRNGEVAGSFITHNNATWYLYDRDDGEIEAFPDDSVRAALVERRAGDDSDDDKTAFEHIRDKLAGLWPF